MRAAPSTTSKREQQGQRSRDEILDAAERLMSKNGYSATSISLLAKECGLPASSIYWHFGSKSGVLAAVMERGANRFFSVTEERLRLRARLPRRRLQELFDASFELIERHLAFLNLFMLLLLGSEGEHVQDEVVASVRRQGRERLANGLRLAYAPWGEQTADHIAEELGELAIALFDGYHLATVANAIGEPEPLEALRTHLVTALHAAAEAIRHSSGARSSRRTR